VFFMKNLLIRTAALVVCMICLTSIIAIPAYAAGEKNGPQPRWTEISVFPCSLTRQSGLFTNAHLLGSVTTYSSYSKIELTVTVQEFTGGAFTDTSRSWSASGNGYAGVTKDIKLPAGSYRLKAVATIYSASGQYIETVTNYSSDIII